MTSDLAMPSTSELTGYNDADTYLATRYRQGGRTLFSIDLSLDQLANTVGQPNPEQPTEGNRKIVYRHAQGFAKYLKTRSDGVIPPLLLRAPDGVFEFNQLDSVGGTDWGTLSVPRNARNDLHIVDGQHRILGIHLLIKELAEALAKARSERAVALKRKDHKLAEEFDKEIAALEAQRHRMNKDRVSIQIIIVDDAQEYKQIFVDIAENAKGITQAVKNRFDSTKVVNRCLEEVMEHQLIAGRVDLDEDRIQGDNPNLLGAKHVADIIRTLQVGIGGRISGQLEPRLKEEDLITETQLFLTLLCRSFDDLGGVGEGIVSPIDLRKRSLLGSVTMLRVLAGVYHELVGANGQADVRTRERMSEFFGKLSRYMETPIAEGSPWLKCKAFQIGANAPRASMGELRDLVTNILAWAKHEPNWLRKD